MKLGNHYLTGSRLELAMAAFEKAIESDVGQIEAHISVANLLMQVKDYSHAHHHLHQVMLSAATSPSLDATNLRELLAHSIFTSFIAADKTKYKYPALRKSGILEMTGSNIDIKWRRVN